jgi:hypothetical protein
MSDERQTYRVLSEVKILDTVYPVGELVDLTEEQAAPLLAATQIELKTAPTPETPPTPPVQPTV